MHPLSQQEEKFYLVHQQMFNLTIYTVELQWLKQAWDIENEFQPKVVPAIQG